MGFLQIWLWIKNNDDIYNDITYVSKYTADNTHSDTLVQTISV